MNEDYFQDDTVMNIECPNCLQDIAVISQELKEKSELTCGECEFRFNYDGTKLNRKFNSLMKNLIGEPRKKPKLN